MAKIFRPLNWLTSQLAASQSPALSLSLCVCVCVCVCVCLRFSACSYPVNPMVPLQCTHKGLFSNEPVNSMLDWCPKRGAKHAQLKTCMHVWLLCKEFYSDAFCCWWPVEMLVRDSCYPKLRVGFLLSSIYNSALARVFCLGNAEPRTLSHKPEP